jgi:predicted amidophosphoribosyltransferase
MSQADGVPVEEIRCDGCLSDHVYGPCTDCRHGFRRCAEEKKVTWCFQCPDFPCKRLEDFSKIHVVNGIWHHKRIIENLQFMKDRGIDEWVKQQEKEGACPSCGKMLYWYSLKCPRCHAVIR